MRRAAGLVLVLLVAGCATARPPAPHPTPRPTPVPTPTPIIITPPGPVTCPADSPEFDAYVLDGGRPSIKPAKPDETFITITAKVHDRDYCAPQVVCAYKGGESGPDHEFRVACERALAYPVWTGATPRDDNPFAADAGRGVHVTVCPRDHPGHCLEFDTP